MGWHGHLQLDYRHDGTRTVARDRHEGPLRVLQSLYPEGPAVCHHVLVHPPGGLVGGDTLEVDIAVAAGAHALLTTPGATRCYRSSGATALQAITLRLAAGARLEWLPLETLAYSGCLAESRVRLELEPGAETMGWDLLALGLPAAEQPFEQGRFVQAIEMPGSWLERGVIDARDRRLLDSPLGFAGRRVLATLWFAAGEPLAEPRREALLDAARHAVAAHALAPWAGVTAAQPRVVVLRVLALAVEPAHGLLADVWRAWRLCAWEMQATPPRVWRT